MFNWLRRNNDKYGQTSSDALIDLRHIKKAYETEAGPFYALRGIDLKVHTGEFVAVVGKSGSGKSTLINMITGIDRPTEGEVIVSNTPIHLLSEGEMAEWRGVNIGIVFQFFQLLPTLTVLENIILPMDFCGLYTTQERIDRAMHLLELVEMPEQAHKLPSAVSGGQQQRAAIARALANDPPIVVADEPTGNLDSKTAGAIFDLFGKLVDEGKTFLMVTHDHDMATRVSRTLTITDGLITDDELSETEALTAVAPA
jgi:putative ABC transport system ATP-binding protein